MKHKLIDLKKILLLLLFVSVYKLVICQNYFNEHTQSDDIRLNTPYIIGDIKYRDARMYRSAEYVKSLKNLLHILSFNKNIEIIVLVHTDNVGSPRYNLRLTERYSKQVKEYLCNFDTTLQSRIINFGYSGRFPIASNHTKEGRRYNRRTEVIFVDTEKTIIQTDTTSYERKNKIYEIAFISKKIKSTKISKKEVKVFPNPMKNSVNIQSKYQIDNIKIMDISGREMISTKQTGIDVSALKPAVYFLRITTKNGIFTQKVIIE